MNKISLTLICVVFSILSKAQNPNFEWVKTEGYQSAKIVKTDATGNIFRTGIFFGTCDFDPGPNVFLLTSSGSNLYTDIFISKFDPSGNFLWVKKIGGVKNEGAWDLGLDATGKIYVTGYFEGTIYFSSGTASLTSLGNGDAFIAKFDSLGDLIWAKSIGGNGNDYGTAIKTDLNGNIFIAGSFVSTIDFDPGNGFYNVTAQYADMFMLKLNASGDFVWVKVTGGPMSYVDCSAVEVDDAGNIYMTGSLAGIVDLDPGQAVSTHSTTGDNDIFITKLDTAGNLLWTKSMGGAANEGSRKMVLDKFNNIYCMGFGATGFDFDPGPGTFSLATTNTLNCFVSKFDKNGNFTWAKTIEGNCYALAIDKEMSIYTSGYFADTSDFDPGPGVFNLISAGSDDIFISKLNYNGDFSWAARIGDTGSDQGSAIAVDNSDNIYTCGSAGGSVDFDISPGTYTLTDQPVIFLLKMNQAIPVGIRENSYDFNASIYPNPVKDIININLPEIVGSTRLTVRILNLQGELLVESEINKVHSSFSIDNLQSGIYFITLTDSNKKLYTKKIIKE